LKKSGCTENDVMLNAYTIWKEDEGTDFGLEHAWRLLKDKPKGRRFRHMGHILHHLI